MSFAISLCLYILDHIGYIQEQNHIGWYIQLISCFIRRCEISSIFVHILKLIVCIPFLFKFLFAFLWEKQDQNLSNALCGYPLVKLPVENFGPLLPFSWVLIISDKIFGVCYLCSFTFKIYLGSRWLQTSIQHLISLI